MVTPVAPGRSLHLGESEHRLEREDSVAESGAHLVLGEPVRGVGDPIGFEAHLPFDERGRRSWPGLVVQEGWGGRFSSGDVFPAGDGVGVASPSANMLSTRLNSVSASFRLAGEPVGPCRVKSMI